MLSYLITPCRRENARSYRLCMSLGGPLAKPSYEHTALLGARNDIWARAWTVSEFPDGNFQVRVSCGSSSSFRDF